DPSSHLDQEAADLMDRIHNRLFVEATVSGWFDSKLNGVKDKNEMIPHLADKLDWLGVNYYTRYVVRGTSSILARLFAGLNVMPNQVKGYGFACEAKSFSLDGRPTSEFRQELYPEGLGQSLIEASHFGRPMYITENGTADSDDSYRPTYLLEHIKVAEQLLDEKKIDLRGYLHWSLTDNYEWAQGFGMKFGLASVDLKTKTRKARKSAGLFKRIAEQGTTQGITV
ncbi:MAG TPA: family 1 glycosylhydrolase, partial [Thermoproteota archaeon]|nr:family 1 glycosylhydrolase [Thermoproteota archaeon]